MAKQSEWSVMRDQDKWLTVPLRGYIYICMWMLWKGVFAGSARRTLWIGVTGRYSSFCLSSIIIEDMSIFFFLTELIRGSIIRFRVFFENDLFRSGNFSVNYHAISLINHIFNILKKSSNEK